MDSLPKKGYPGHDRVDSGPRARGCAGRFRPEFSRPAIPKHCPIQWVGNGNPATPPAPYYQGGKQACGQFFRVGK